MTLLPLSRVSLLYLALSLAFLSRCLLAIRMVKLEGFCQRFLWSVRLHHRRNPKFPTTLDEWRLDHAEPGYRLVASDDAWLFLKPFFAARGYTLYEKAEKSSVYEPPLEPAPAPTSLQRHPYARTIPDGTLDGVSNDYDMMRNKPALWVARDSLGRDVVIKIISDILNPTEEWIILQKLNESTLRQDPDNYTIPVLEFVTFDNLVFAVMPRWDRAFDPPFTTVEELMEVTKAYLKALNFLHAHRIAHLDIHRGNCGMNMYAGRDATYCTTVMRRPEEVRYAFYDFGHSAMYPKVTDLGSVSINRHIRFLHAPGPRMPYNPFKADIAMLGGLLLGSVMHAVDTVPAIGPFLYRMMDLDENKRPTSSEALEEFMQIYNGLSQSQLQTHVDARWDNNIRSKFLPDAGTLWKERYGHLNRQRGQ